MNLMINVIIECLPEISVLIMSLVSALIGKKIVPLIASKLHKSNIEITKEQLMDIQEWMRIFVNSAQRLDKAGNLDGVTKKEYVTNKIMIYVEQSGYIFTQEQLDDIRRSAVYLLEQSEAIIKDAIVDVVEDVVVE